MERYFINQIISIGQGISGEVLSGLLLLFLYLCILILWKVWAKQGLYVYLALAVVFANIQVLKTSSFILTYEPVALGTILFATTFLVSDILTEHYGLDTAKTAISLSVFAQVFVTLLMLITLSKPPEEW